MTSSLQGKRYAQAAFELAIEDEGVDSWQNDLQKMAEVFAISEFAEFLSAPHVPLSAKAKGVSTLLTGVIQHVRNLANILVERRQTGVVPSIIAEFAKLADKERGVLRGKVVTATPVTEARMLSIKRSLAQVLDSKPGNLMLDEEVDPSIIGGISVQVGSRLIDGSVRSRLRELKSNLETGTVTFGTGTAAEDEGIEPSEEKRTRKTSKRKASK